MKDDQIMKFRTADKIGLNEGKVTKNKEKLGMKVFKITHKAELGLDPPFCVRMNP
jgi:hypothetical protein